MLTGLNHLTFAVRDVARAWQFYVEVLGCRPVARWPQGGYVLAGDLWVALVQDAQTRAGPWPEYTHAAFSVSAADFPRLAERLRAAGAVIWQANWTEGESLYFLDPDGHKLEIHASDLAARLRSAREQPWAGLEFFD